MGATYPPSCHVVVGHVALALTAQVAP
jgi:hypothetical protein